MTTKIIFLNRRERNRPPWAVAMGMETTNIASKIIHRHVNKIKYIKTTRTLLTHLERDHERQLQKEIGSNADGFVTLHERWDEALLLSEPVIIQSFQTVCRWISAVCRNSTWGSYLLIILETTHQVGT